MKDVKIVAICGLVILEASAILTHTDGVYFMPVVAAVAGIAGFHLGKNETGIKKVIKTIKKK
jgi:hypothetical protein